jgi:hypothetical protein
VGVRIDEPVVGDCDAVRVSGQIVQNVIGTTEGALRIHHPVFAKQRPQKPPEGGLVRQRKACAIKSELLPAKVALQPSQICHERRGSRPSPDAFGNAEPAIDAGGGRRRTLRGLKANVVEQRGLID